MSHSIFVDAVYGFMTQVELSSEDIEDLDKVGVMASPMLYTTEDSTKQYIVGKLISSLRGAGQYETLEFHPSDEEKAQMKADIFKGLDECGFDVKDKECKLWINTYYS